MTLRAALFDKDGTLVDFHDTWDAAVGTGLRTAATDNVVLNRAAKIIDFDLEANSIRPNSVLIAEPNDVILELLGPVLDVETFFQVTVDATVGAVVAAAGLPQALHDLRTHGLALGVVTNDYEAISKKQLETLGWRDLFAHVVASDSGFGSKPDPGMIERALALFEVLPSEAVTIGDTAHDLRAGRAAGVFTILVTNGALAGVDLVELADLRIETLDELVPALQHHGLLSKHPQD